MRRDTVTPPSLTFPLKHFHVNSVVPLTFYEYYISLPYSVSAFVLMIKPGGFHVRPSLLGAET